MEEKVLGIEAYENDNKAQEPHKVVDYTQNDNDE